MGRGSELTHNGGYRPTRYQTKTNNFGAFGGPGYMGLVATMWVPMGARVPIFHQMITQSKSQRQQKDFQKSHFRKIFRCH